MGSVLLFAYDLQNFAAIERFDMYNHVAFELALIVLLIIVALKSYKERIKSAIMRDITLSVLFLLLTTTFWEEKQICNIVHGLAYFYVLIILIIITGKNARVKEISQ